MLLLFFYLNATDNGRKSESNRERASSNVSATNNKRLKDITIIYRHPFGKIVEMDVFLAGLRCSVIDIKLSTKTIELFNDHCSIEKLCVSFIIFLPRLPNTTHVYTLSFSIEHSTNIFPTCAYLQHMFAIPPYVLVIKARNQHKNYS